jgi:hypothetical protein
MVITTGFGPQEKVMTPPAATAATTAADVQLAAVPSPTVRVGREVSTARAAAGTAACPPGFPYRGALCGGGDVREVRGVGRGVPLGDAAALVAGPVAPAGLVLAGPDGEFACREAWSSEPPEPPQPASTAQLTRHAPRRTRAGSAARIDGIARC